MNDNNKPFLILKSNQKLDTYQLGLHKALSGDPEQLLEAAKSSNIFKYIKIGKLNGYLKADLVLKPNLSGFQITGSDNGLPKHNLIFKRHSMLGGFDKFQIKMDTGYFLNRFEFLNTIGDVWSNIFTGDNLEMRFHTVMPGQTTSTICQIKQSSEIPLNQFSYSFGLKQRLRGILFEVGKKKLINKNYDFKYLKLKWKPLVGYEDVQIQTKGITEIFGFNSQKYKLVFSFIFKTTFFNLIPNLEYITNLDIISSNYVNKETNQYCFWTQRKNINNKSNTYINLGTSVYYNKIALFRKYKVLPFFRIELHKNLSNKSKIQYSIGFEKGLFENKSKIKLSYDLMNSSLNFYLFKNN